MTLALSFTLLLAASASFQWPVPEGWDHETIPFPLPFAPSLPFKGVEELRFSPGWSKPDQPGYWSYAFVWWLDGKPAIGAPELNAALKSYFAGLSTSVGKDKGFAIDPSKFAASFHAIEGSKDKLGHSVRAFAGTVDSYDAFATGKPITLNVDVWVWDCDRSGKTAVAILASPKAADDAIWGSLRKRRDELICHP